jgi:hypothetical protein
MTQQLMLALTESDGPADAGGPRAWALYSGTPRHPHRWLAMVAPAEFQRDAVWTGTTVHRDTSSAIAEAAAQLARREAA